MRRPICLLAAAVATGSLVAGVGIASAAGGSAGKPVKPVVLRCHIKVATQPPPGSNSVNQPSAHGRQYGPISCPTASFGGGVQTNTFTVPDSGDMKGTYIQYFHGGTVKGSFDLVPDQDKPTSNQNSFTSQSWAGKLNVTGGTGVYQGIKGKTSTSVLKCKSPDEVHLTCTEKVKVTFPPPAP